MEGPVKTVAWDELTARIGEKIGASEWTTVNQAMIDAFADLTGDHYFIHTDPQRAARLPFGGTIAHGFLTLSLVSVMGYQVCPLIQGTRYPLNYGFNRVRFVAPVPVGARVRGHFVLRAADVVAPEQRQMVYDVTVEIEGTDKPALVAEWLTRAIM
jgi:acyl dehydratase